MPVNFGNGDVESLEKRVVAQMDLIKSFTDNRRQTIINLALGSVAIATLASDFSELNFQLKLGVAILIFFVLSVFWYDAYVNKKAIINSQNVLGSILGEKFLKDIKNISSKQNFLSKNFTEVSLTVFTVIVIYFIFFLFFDAHENDSLLFIDSSKECSITKIAQ